MAANTLFPAKAHHHPSCFKNSFKNSFFLFPASEHHATVSKEHSFSPSLDQDIWRCFTFRFLTNCNCYKQAKHPLKGLLWHWIFVEYLWSVFRYLLNIWKGGKTQLFKDLLWHFPINFCRFLSARCCWVKMMIIFFCLGNRHFIDNVHDRSYIDDHKSQWDIWTGQYWVN